MTQVILRGNEITSVLDSGVRNNNFKLLSNMLLSLRPIKNDKKGRKNNQWNASCWLFLLIADTWRFWSLLKNEIFYVLFSEKPILNTFYSVLHRCLMRSIFIPEILRYGKFWTNESTSAYYSLKHSVLHFVSINVCIVKISNVMV